MTKNLWIGIGVLVLVVVLAFLVKKPAPTNNEPIKIGAALALTGDAASWGEMSLKGAAMAVEELNKKGGIHGQSIELVVEDTKSTSQGTLSSVQKLVSMDKVSAIVGPSWLDIYQGSQSIIAGKNIAMITPDAGVEAFNTPKMSENVFSIWYRSQPKAALLMKFLHDKGVKRLVLIHQNDGYYNDLATRFEKEATVYGISIVRHESINGGETDFKTLLTKIKQDDADMVFFALYDQKAMDAFFKNRNQLGLQIPLVTDEFGQDYLENPDYSALVNDMYFFSATRQDDAFEKKFKEQYNGTIPKFGASHGYDSVMVLAEALEKQPDDIVGYIKNTEFKTITFGDMKFDDINGVATENETYVMKQIQNNQAVILK